MSDFKMLFITNMVVECAWIAGAYFLAVSDHPVMGGWCIVGAIISGINYTRKKNADSD